MKSRGKARFKREGKFWVYIVECKDGTYYTGYTPNLENRIKLHNDGKGAKYTRGRGPVKLVYCKEYRSCKNAMRAELDIKKRTRIEKETMIRAHKNNTMSFAPLICREKRSKSKQGADNQRCEL